MSTRFSESKKRALLLTPEVLTALNALVEKSSHTRPDVKDVESLAAEASQTPLWTIGYNDNTSDRDRDLAYVLSLPNSPKRMITRIILESGKYQRPDIEISFRSGSLQGWEASCSGDIKDVLTFRDEFEQLVHGAIPRYSWLAVSDAGPNAIFAIGVALGALVTLAGGKVLPLEVLRILLLTAVGMAASIIAFLFVRPAVWPRFETTIGDGARRHKVRDGWRTWASAGFTTILLGLIVSAIWSVITTAPAATPNSEAPPPTESGAPKQR